MSLLLRPAADPSIAEGMFPVVRRCLVLTVSIDLATLPISVADCSAMSIASGVVSRWGPNPLVCRLGVSIPVKNKYTCNVPCDCFVSPFALLEIAHKVFLRKKSQFANY